jgi:hypothetical protein
MRVKVVDVYGERLEVDADIWLQSPGYGREARQIAEDVPPGAVAEFDAEPTETYLVRVMAPGYSMVTKLVRGTNGELEVVVPVDPDEVELCDFFEPVPDIPGVTVRSTPATSWDSLDTTRKGATLNIWAKLLATWVGASPAAVYVERVLEVREDRLICRVAAELVELLEGNLEVYVGGFDRVPSLLHDPPAGYARGSSFKTRDEHGNLQISFFIGESDVLADCDIDENRGALAHLFDVVEHHATRTKTNPIEVHQILVAQGLDPGWRPLLKLEETAKA